MGLINMLANLLGAIQVIIFTKYNSQIGIYGIQVSILVAVIIFAMIPEERKINSVRSV